MKIAVLSGKGGTGKTLVSVNLAAVSEKSVYIDCDVEEPNGHLFFKPKEIAKENVVINIPFANVSNCNGCRKCVDFCKFNALASIKGELIVFEEVCHSCGGCVLFCPSGAIQLRQKIIGEIQKGISGDVTVISGIMNVGEASGVPVIRKLLKNTCNPDGFLWIDCPPGSACVVMESIRHANYCILVAEPTIFGVHNLQMVHELVILMDKPHGVILNKCMGGDNPAEEYCKEKGITILGVIPFDYELGTLNSNGLIPARQMEKYKYLFETLLDNVSGEVKTNREAVADSQW